jgi:hypothetical protein
MFPKGGCTGGCQLVGERSKQKRHGTVTVATSEMCNQLKEKKSNVPKRKEKKSNGLNVIRNFIAKEVKQGMIRDIENVQVSSNQQRKRKSQRKL